VAAVELGMPAGAGANVKGADMDSHDLDLLADEMREVPGCTKVCLTDRVCIAPKHVWLSLRKRGVVEFTDKALEDAIVFNKPIAVVRPWEGFASHSLWVETHAPFHLPPPERHIT
jgi:hypothetical protein